VSVYTCISFQNTKCTTQLISIYFGSYECNITRTLYKAHICHFNDELWLIILWGEGQYAMYRSITLNFYFKLFDMVIFLRKFKKAVYDRAV
jgi:hypothetical protein